MVRTMFIGILAGAIMLLAGMITGQIVQTIIPSLKEEYQNAIIGLPGMIISYSTFPVSFFLIFSWTISGLVQNLCAGILFSKLLRQDSPNG